VFGQRKRPHDDSLYEVYGHKITVSHDGGDMKVRVSRSALHSKENQGFEGEGLEGTKEAVRMAIASLYSELDPARG
jgi:hypothetical protein